MPKELTQFKPGQSGNPAGRPKGSLRKAVKEATKETVSNIIDLVFNKPEAVLKDHMKFNSAKLSRAERVILSKSHEMRTLEFLLDRVVGKPTNTILEADLNNNRININLAYPDREE